MKGRAGVAPNHGRVGDATRLVAGRERKSDGGRCRLLGKSAFSALSTLTQPSPNPGRGFICGFILRCIGLAGGSIRRLYSRQAPLLSPRIGGEEGLGEERGP